MHHFAKIVFTGSDLRTDFKIYRSFSQLLLPMGRSTNEFFVECRDGKVHFFVGSDDHTSFNFISRFFMRLYPSYVVQEAPDLRDRNWRRYLMGRGDRRSGEFYFPDLMDSIVSFHHTFPDIDLTYRCSIISSRSRSTIRYSVYIDVAVGQSSLNTDGIFALFERTLGYLRMRHGVRLRRNMLLPMIMDNKMRYTFNLINFVRIPVDIDV
ncbi:hypothetical protein DMB44_07215 [Thermoplasma sp. Kam2015]|uniref:hypothetical protein n=1 Tax=Thermoplasma sp. Kam2015 TaxID=2094122 RepID=UPI000D8CA842|nr:hypothetical protein [Thermoplasma sp. Kam2015]PYB67819.1 hypothetical protein DMB44_07215 [Thermoplasma sp. Kam2015]